MNDLTRKLRDIVTDLFDKGSIDLFIGYEQGSLPGTTTPCFIRSKDQVDRLIWDSFCSNNLAVYLPRYFLPPSQGKEKTFPKIGIAVKGCDGRNLVVICNENQVPRANITIVGLACSGIIDNDKLQNSIKGTEVVEAKEETTKICVVDDEGTKTELAKESLLADSCLACEDSLSPIADIVVGEKIDNDFIKSTVIEEFEGSNIETRWNHFEQEMAKCIRCYACRQACPLCYCRECFAEQTNPRWMGTGSALSELMMFHLGRMIHTTGRCVDCGACARACPMGVDLRTFQRKLVEVVENQFGYKPGMTMDEIAPLATFTLADKEEFITKPK